MLLLIPEEKVNHIHEAIDGVAYRDPHGWWCMGCGGSVSTKDRHYICDRGCFRTHITVCWDPDPNGCGEEHCCGRKRIERIDFTSRKRAADEMRDLRERGYRPWIE